MSNKITYPEVDFVNTDTEELTNSLIKSYETFTGRNLYPADPVRMFILWLTAVIVQERVEINKSAKQNLPRYAEDEYLDSIAEIFRDVSRLEATPATTTFRFYISIPLEEAQVIEKGTRVTVDGNITFETQENLYIDAGSTYGDVSAICQTSGNIGNGFLPGQITKIVDVYPYYDKAENITVSEGGADRESDKAFYERMRESMETYSTAGSEGAYSYHAKTVSPLISDVAVTSPEAGTVDIKLLLNNGELPSEEIINQVSKVLSEEKIRPMTDNVIVSAADTELFEIEITYYTEKYPERNPKIIADNVEKAVSEFVMWQTEKMGRDVNPSRLISLVMKTDGVKRIEINKPDYMKINQGCVALPQNIKIMNGGVEDE